MLNNFNQFTINDVVCYLTQTAKLPTVPDRSMKDVVVVVGVTGIYVCTLVVRIFPRGARFLTSTRYLESKIRQGTVLNQRKRDYFILCLGSCGFIAGG